MSEAQGLKMTILAKSTCRPLTHYPHIFYCPNQLPGNWSFYIWFSRSKDNVESLGKNDVWTLNDMSEKNNSQNLFLIHENTQI